MNCNPTVCPDCPYPPNFQITALPHKESSIQKYEIECRSCNDIWIEVEVESTSQIDDDYFLDK